MSDNPEPFHVVFLLGPPGAGKGTQSEKAAEFLQVPRISIGDMLRESVRRKTPLGITAKLLMEAGRLVPDDLVCQMVAHRIAGSDCRRGFILDGFPRTVGQALALDKELRQIADRKKEGPIKPLAVLIVVSTSTLLSRLSGRLVCTKCASTFNSNTRPPRVLNVCDFDSANLTIRPDDREDTILERLKVYDVQTMPLIAHYRDQGQLREIEGDCSVKEVTEKIVELIGGQ